MAELIHVSAITKLHKECIIHWKSSSEVMEYKHQNFYRLVEENHTFNYQLWHAEDKARRDDMGYEFVYRAKREIDQHNQCRNNRMEAMDAWLFNFLHPAPPTECAVNSESPGMIIDRLSILALKSYHMALQTQRQDVDETHRTNCSDKLRVIHQQLEQLAHCLELFLNEIQEKKRTFRIYHQFKMYNDPKLNPELYLNQE
jgi:hypothetical protein